MGDQDWLENGHGGGEGLRSMIKGSTEPVAERVSIRRVLRGPDTAGPRASRRRTKALVGWLLYCCTAVGGTAAAFTVRDTLFPSLGAPTQPAIWADNPDTTLTTEHGALSTEGKESTLEAITVPTTASTLASSIEDQTVPASPASSVAPVSSVDNRGPGGDGPSTGTTVVSPTSSGPGPGTTVDDHPTVSSTPGSASTPTSADVTPTSPSTPAPSASDSGQNGKGGGGGGGGGGSPGGPPPSTP